MSEMRILIICPTCHEHLGVVDGYSAEWRADKTQQEHDAERHD